LLSVPLMSRYGLFAVCWLLVSAIMAMFATPSYAQKPMTLDQVEAIVHQMQQAHAALDDYIAVLNQRLRDEDELLPPERVLFKFKKPYSIYLRWLDGGTKGREVLYVDGADDGKMWVHNGAFPDITLRLDPKTCQALTGGKHLVTETGLGFIANVIASDVARAKSHPLDKVRCWDYGKRVIHGEPSRCFELITPPRRDSGYYSYRAFVCQSQLTGLLNKITVWDFRNLLVEDYGFENTRVNVGLAANDFNPKNPEYQF